MAQMQALKAQAKLAKKKLNEEKEWISSYLEDIFELKLGSDCHAKRCY